MERFAFMLVLAVLAASPVHSQTTTPLKLTVFPGGLSWPVFVAQDRGFFAAQKLDVVVTFTPGSVIQVQGILSGSFDVAMGVRHRTGRIARFVARTGNAGRAVPIEL